MSPSVRKKLHSWKDNEAKSYLQKVILKEMLSESRDDKEQTIKEISPLKGENNRH